MLRVLPQQDTFWETNIGKELHIVSLTFEHNHVQMFAFLSVRILQDLNHRNTSLSLFTKTCTIKVVYQLTAVLKTDEGSLKANIVNVYAFPIVNIDKSTYICLGQRSISHLPHSSSFTDV